MRRVRSVATAALLAALSACAQGPEPGPVTAGASVTTAATALGAGWSAGADDGMSWFYNPASDGVKLAYGAPTSDAVRLMIYCQGAGRVRLETTSPGSPPERSLRLASGASETRLPLADEESPMGGRLLSAQADAGAPALNAFRSSGQLTMSAGAAAVPLHASAAEAQAVDSFFRACGG